MEAAQVKPISNHLLDTVYWRYTGFTLSYNLARPLDQWIIWLFGKKPIKISQYPTGFRGYGRENNGFSLLRDFARPPNQNAM